MSNEGFDEEQGRESEDEKRGIGSEARNKQ